MRFGGGLIFMRAYFGGAYNIQGKGLRQRTFFLHFHLSNEDKITDF